MVELLKIAVSVRKTVSKHVPLMKAPEHGIVAAD
jgi:hypothetical protein